jgi:hypothetical protein
MYYSYTTSFKEPERKLNTVCIHAGEVVLDFYACADCPEMLTTCVPRVDVNGYVHGECDVFLCEGCDATTCMYYYEPQYYKRSYELCESI